MKKILIFIFLSCYMVGYGQWKEEYIRKDLEEGNSSQSKYKYEVSGIKKTNTLWIVSYRIVPINKYLCLFCGELDCPAEMCRREKGVSFTFIDSTTVKAIYGKGHISAMEINRCSEYGQTPARIIKSKQYKIIY